MTTLYVRSPFSAVNWGQACYCHFTGSGCCGNGCGTNSSGACRCTHSVIAFNYPQDVGNDTPSLTVKFWASPSNLVNSIRLEKVDYCCSSRAEPWTIGTLITMFSNANGTGEIGKVLYGHVQPIQSYGFFNSNIYGKTIGYLPDTDCNCGCYDGHHAHMETVNGQRSGSFTCDQTLYAGTTNIFTYTY